MSKTDEQNEYYKKMMSSLQEGVDKAGRDNIFEDYIMIGLEECPTIDELKIAVARLTKDVKILTNLNMKEFPVDALKKVLSFLELVSKNDRLVKKYKRGK